LTISNNKFISAEIKDTYSKFVYVGNHLEAFLKWKFKKAEDPLKELSLQFLDDFDYLKTEKKQEQITINKTIQRLRTPIKASYFREAIWIETPLYFISPKLFVKQLYFFTTEELKTLENAVLQKKDL
jgi:hypothetical protein